MRTLVKQSLTHTLFHEVTIRRLAKGAHALGAAQALRSSCFPPRRDLHVLPRLSSAVRSSRARIAGACLPSPKRDVALTRACATLQNNDVPCGDVAAVNITSCVSLAKCIDEAIEAGTLPPWSGGSDSEGVAATSPTALATWFTIFYFGYYFFTWTCTMIPYDALGGRALACQGVFV